MKKKPLIDQKREAEVLNKALDWGLTDDFFQVELPTMKFTPTDSELIVMSPHLPGACGLTSLQRTFWELVRFIEKRAKLQKMKFSISKELSHLDGLSLIKGDFKPGIEFATFDCRDNYNYHDGIVISDLVERSKEHEQFVSIQALWAMVFFPEYFQKVNGKEMPNVAMAGLCLYPRGSYGSSPKTIGLSRSGKEISINTIDSGRHTFFAAPRVKILDLSY